MGQSMGWPLARITGQSACQSQLFREISPLLLTCFLAAAANAVQHSSAGEWDAPA